MATALTWVPTRNYYGVVTVTPRRGHAVKPSTVILHSDSLNSPLTAPHRIDERTTRFVVRLPDDDKSKKPLHAFVQPYESNDGIDWLNDVSVWMHGDEDDATTVYSSKETFTHAGGYILCAQSQV